MKKYVRSGVTGGVLGAAILILYSFVTSGAVDWRAAILYAVIFTAGFIAFSAVLGRRS